jgi:hypothetical protein
MQELEAGLVCILGLCGIDAALFGGVHVAGMVGAIVTWPMSVIAFGVALSFGVATVLFWLVVGIAALGGVTRL